MENKIKGFLSYLELHDGYINLPDTITKDNVNTPLYNGIFQNTSCLLKESIYDCNEDIIKFLISIGADFTFDCLEAVTNEQQVKLLLELGISFDSRIMDKSVNNPKIMFFLIDYGVKIPKFWRIYKQFKRYTDYDDSVVKYRVRVCREYLLALIYICKRSPLFRPLGGIIKDFTKQAWRLRGSEGCGPRGKGWGYLIL